MKILVISLAGIGDTMFATPLIHELCLNFPGAQIDALVLWPGSKDLLMGNPFLNRVYQKNMIKDGALNSLKYLAGLRKERYDVSINTHPQSRIHYRVVARIINARERLSHVYDNSGWLDQRLVNRTLPQDYAVHAIENNLRLLTLLGKKTMMEPHEIELFLAEEDLLWAEDFVQRNQLAGRRLAGLHVGTGGTKNLALRRWPLHSYLDLIRRLEQSHPELSIVLFGGPEERKDHETILQRLGKCSVIEARTQNLGQAAALIQHCGIFLSVDTVMMHLAAAMKVPKQIVIETPTFNKPVEPYRQPFDLVRNPMVDGRNLEFYRYDGRGIHGSREALVKCMAAVTVEDVYRIMERAMDSKE